MKLGLLVRAENRGLGIQSWEAHRHLSPTRTMVIDTENPEGFPLHLDRFPDAEVVRLQSGLWLPEALVRDWLAGLDVLLSFETLYDWRVADWARDAGCATVVQLNPEFFQHDHLDLPAPDVWWNPTTWRADMLPATVRHVPVPVALDRFCAGWAIDPELASTCPCQDGDACHWRGDDPLALRPPHEGPLRVLHVVGRPALADRNGTELLTKALRRVQGVQLTALSQRHTDHAPGVVVGEVEDYWRLYDAQDVLVLPRRYGGLCLPAQEAMAAGLAVVMPSCPPNDTMWPIVPVRWQYRGELPVPAGHVRMAETDARDLAVVIGRLAAEPEELAFHQGRAAGWAETHSWGVLLPLYMEELARAADGARVP